MSFASGVATIPGWYGKLPSLGDFASRRLEPAFIDPWDLWLGEGLQAQREAFGEQWLDAYVHSPAWRFLLAPGAMPRQAPAGAIAGVLMPSVDRVGRHFPLTIAAPIDRMPRIASEFDALLAWMHRLEDTALDAVQGGWGIDDLEQALAALSPPDDATRTPTDEPLSAVRSAVAEAVASRGGFVDIARIASRSELAAVFSGEPTASEVAARLPTPSLRGVAIWLSDTPGRPQLLISKGLPDRDAFVRMFSGDAAAASPQPPVTGDAEATRAQGLQAGAGEDLLPTLPQPLGPPIAAGASALGSRNDDLLRMFDTAPNAVAAADAPPLPDDDILALFGAGTAPVEARPADAGRSDEPDILALFDVPPAEPDAGKTQ